MKILWLVNIVLPEAGEVLQINSSVFGGWLTGALSEIRNCVDVTVLTVGGNDVPQIMECDVNTVHYVVLPKQNEKELKKAFRKYLSDYSFDVIHIYGTEMLHSSVMMEVVPLEKTVINIQGLCSTISQHYLEGIPYKYVNEPIIKKIFRILTQRIEPSAQKEWIEFCQDGERELRMLKEARYVIGRTNWDRAWTFQVNPGLKYFHVDATLRESFYYTNKIWLPENCERHSIFISQASYPVKGIHYFIKALGIIKRFYPDVKVYIAGPRGGLRNLTELRKIKNKYLGGYWGYVNTIAYENNVTSCCQYTGLLTEQQMVDQYLKSNVVVISSTIENESNTVCEAMMLGTPVVASYVGGIPDMLDNGKEGLLYQTSAPYMLADCVMRIFADDDLAMTLSANAIARAHITHDKKKNADALLAVYKKIIQSTEK